MNDNNDLQTPSILNPTSCTTPTTITSPPNTINNQQINRASKTSQSTPLSSLGITINTSKVIQKNENFGEALESNVIKGLN